MLACPAMFTPPDGDASPVAALPAPNAIVGAVGAPEPWVLTEGSMTKPSVLTTVVTDVMPAQNSTSSTLTLLVGGFQRVNLLASVAAITGRATPAIRDPP